MTMTHRGESFSVQLEDPVDLSIALQFDGAQPNYFGVAEASSSPVSVGAFTGDTRTGASCNVESLTMIPHCNGTHTECVGHVTDDRTSVLDCATDALVPARLVTIDPVPAESTTESTEPSPVTGDRLITSKALVDALDGASPETALILRTLPNDASKLSKHYDVASPTPYFSVEAAHWLVNSGVRHLLVDIPSIDRLADGGLLTAHRIFWGLSAGSHRISDATRKEATVTEMIYVADTVADGLYLLNLQIPAFQSDAVPSRPLLFRMIGQ